MINSVIRPDGRACDQLRPLKVSYDVFGYSGCSILFEIGNTKVLCSVTLQQGVPPFLKGSGTGWLNAEYAMLPTATTIRTQRDGSTQKKNGRSIEISRLISRALRLAVDLSKIGERTITIDCDVLQADGGTRTACITASYFALIHAVNRWVEAKDIAQSCINEALVAISAGMYKGVPILDPDFSEDSEIDADFNFVITQSGDIVEVQGTAEKKAVSWKHFDELKQLAVQGTQQLFAFFEQHKPLVTPERIAITENKKHALSHSNKKTTPLFSLGNRLKPSEGA